MKKISLLTIVTFLALEISVEARNNRRVASPKTPIYAGGQSSISSSTKSSTGVNRIDLVFDKNFVVLEDVNTVAWMKKGNNILRFGAITENHGDNVEIYQINSAEDYDLYYNNKLLSQYKHINGEPYIFNTTIEGEEGTDEYTKSEIANELSAKISAVKDSCSGIKKSLDTIFGLSTATAVSSGLGTVAAGGALAMGITKDYMEKKQEQIDANGEDKHFKTDPKTVGHIRTGLLAGATATSAVSTGTSIGATLTATKLAEKMAQCNTDLQALKLTKATADAEEVKDTLPPMVSAKNIISACTGFDESNIKQLKSLAIANTVVSGIGTAAAGAGTVTSVMANTDKVRNDDSEKGVKKEKTLNLVSNIAAGVATGTSATSTTLSAVQIGKAKKDSEMAEKCENALAQ